MLPRGVYTPLGIIACALDVFTGHTMSSRGVYTPLGIITCPPRPV